MANNHGIATSTGEQRARDFDMQHSYVDDGGVPDVPSSSLTLDAFATDAYIAEGSAGQVELTFARQAAVAVTLTAVDGIHWLAIDTSTFAVRAGWTRPVFGAHYLLQQVTLQPAMSDGLLVLAQITVAGSVITAVVNVASFDASPANIVNVADFGAIPTDDEATGFDSFAAITAAIATLTNGSAIYFPPTPNANFFRITQSLVFPRLNGINIFGNGMRSSHIHVVGSATDCFTWGSPTSQINGTVVRDIQLSAETKGTNTGIVWDRVSRSRMFRVRVTGFNVGIHSIDSLVWRLADSEIDSNIIGLLQDSVGITGPNSIYITGSTFNANTDWGLSFNDGAGVAIIGNDFESNASNNVEASGNFGGIRSVTSSRAWTIAGSYFEQNLAAAGPATYHDILIGANAEHTSGFIAGNLFNGRGITETADYTPLTLNRATGFHVTGNYLNVGNRFVRFGSNSVENVVEQTNFHPTPGQVDVTDPSTIYAITTPDLFAFSGNRIVDEALLPYDGSNLIVGDMPFAGFSFNAGGGTSTFIHPAIDFHGRRIVGQIDRPSGQPTPFLTRTAITIDADNEEQLRNNFITFEIYAKASASGTLRVILNGTNIDHSVSTTWTQFKATAFLSSSATTVTLQLNLQTEVTMDLAAPRFYRGLASLGDASSVGGVPYWTSGAIPTDGTWVQKDIIWVNNPTGATPNVLFVCTVGGSSGGTWATLTAN